MKHQANIVHNAVWNGIQIRIFAQFNISGEPFVTIHVDAEKLQWPLVWRMYSVD